MMCGNKETKLQPHHFIFTSKTSLYHRYNPKNGISLCHGCHNCKIHRNPGLDNILNLKDAAIEGGVITLSELNDIRKSGKDNVGVRFNRVKLNEIIEDLTNELKEYDVS